MGYFNFKWQVYSASATRRTYDRNTDKGEVGGSSPPRPTIQSYLCLRPRRPVNTRRFSLFPFSGPSLKKPFCQPFVNFTIGRMALHSGR
jgi:hypothetical protein